MNTWLHFTSMTWVLCSEGEHFREHSLSYPRKSSNSRRRSDYITKMYRRVEGNAVSSTCEGSVLCKISRLDGSSLLLIRVYTTPYILSEEWLSDCQNGKLPYWTNCRFTIKQVVFPSVLIPFIFLPLINVRSHVVQTSEKTSEAWVGSLFTRPYPSLSRYSLRLYYRVIYYFARKFAERLE